MADAAFPPVVDVLHMKRRGEDRRAAVEDRLIEEARRRTSTATGAGRQALRVAAIVMIAFDSRS
jgi:hypothetical protein